MEEDIEKLIELSGNKNKYQYFTLVTIVFLWINCSYLFIFMPYIEREPLISYWDKEGNLNEEVTLTNEICEEYEGKYTVLERFNYSWVSEFGIECDKLDVSMIGIFIFIGSTIGGLVFSFANKIFSHKKILIISLIGQIISTFLNTLVTSYSYFYFALVCLLFSSLFAECLSFSSLVLVEEIVSSEKRSLFSSIVNIGYSLCGVLYSLGFLFAQDWRIVFYIIIGAEVLLTIVIWTFIYDSPREFINKKDKKTTLQILEGIAAFNGRLNIFKKKIKTEEYQKILDKMDENDLDVKDEKLVTDDSQMNEGDENKEKKEKEEEEEEKEENLNNKKKNIKITISSLFKYPSIRIKFIILNVLWAGARTSFNGISIASKTFKGNFYLNIILLFIIESISYFVTGFVIDIKKLGRRGSLWIYGGSIILVLLLLAFIKLDIIPELVLNYFCRFLASGIEVIYYTYSIEIYPTPLRSLAFGINATFGNATSTIAPLILEYLEYWLFLSVLAAIIAVNSILLIFLPETVGKPMIESIPELEDS